MEHFLQKILFCKFCSGMGDCIMYPQQFDQNVVSFDQNGIGYNASGQMVGPMVK